MNGSVIWIVAILFTMCAAGAGNNAAFAAGAGKDHAYLQLPANTAATFLSTFFSYFLLNASFIPVSLYVTMRLARSFQKLLMEVDADMVTAVGQLSKPMKVLTMDLNDELGQISHIFTDKTGTLTKNDMVFRKLSVNGVSYGKGTTEVGIARREREGVAPEVCSWRACHV